MRWAEVSARRLRRNHLTDATLIDDPARIAADVLGVHAQVMSAAEVSIGVRSESLTRTDVRAALWKQRTLVKTRGPRGTVHLLAAADLPMWTGALSAVPTRRSPFPPGARITDEQTEQVVAAIAGAVEDAELTVDELTDAIVARIGSWAGDRVMEAFQDKWPRWRQVEAIASNRGVVCFGSGRGRRATYTSPNRWLPDFRPAAAEEALAALVRRYLDAYGPATPQDFARWLGVPPDWSAKLFASLGDLEEVDIDGTRTWITGGDGEAAGGESMVRLLPYFDAYLIGCHPRAKLFPGRAAERALTGGQAGNVPALLVDGVVGGVWQQRKSGPKVAITVEPMTRLTARQRTALTAQAVRIGRILEGTATLTLGTVTVGAHA
jgi:hypothetical protein